MPTLYLTRKGALSFNGLNLMTKESLFAKKGRQSRLDAVLPFKNNNRSGTRTISQIFQNYSIFRCSALLCMQKSSPGQTKSKLVFRLIIIKQLRF